jgi:RNA polymerase sigma factor (sigma-70 family)
VSPKFITSDKREILSRLSQNSEDEGAWHDLYIAFWPFVFAKIYRLLNGNPQQTKELSHDVFVRVARYHPFSQTDSVPKFYNYLGAACDNLVHDFYRQTQRYGEMHRNLLNENLIVSSSSSKGRALEELLPELFPRLENTEQVLLTLLIEGATTSEIAENLSTSLGNARVRIYRLRIKLKAMVPTTGRGSVPASYTHEKVRFL